MTVYSSIISKGGLLGPQNTRNSLCISLEPARVTCLSLVSASSTAYFAGFSYNWNNISVRMCHSPDTNASVFQLEGVKKDYESVCAKIRPTFEYPALNSFNSYMFFNDKTSNLFEDTRETCKISLSRLKQEKIVSAFPKSKSDHKRDPLH